jgi:hypothetical protein
MKRKHIIVWGKPIPLYVNKQYEIILFKLYTFTCLSKKLTHPHGHIYR